jgi:hypothetical protein
MKQTRVRVGRKEEGKLNEAVIISGANTMQCVIPVQTAPGKVGKR